METVQDQNIEERGARGARRRRGRGGGRGREKGAEGNGTSREWGGKRLRAESLSSESRSVLI
jgi:hypothetical protein